jgi:hypothetical protein
MPNQKFPSHVLKSQLMEALKFQYSNVLVHQSQQPASHAHLRHAVIAAHDQQQVAQSVHHLIAEHDQQQVALNVKHLNVHLLIVHVPSVLLQIVRVMIVHVLMHHAAKNQHLKRLSMTSAKSQRLVQLSL